MTIRRRLALWYSSLLAVIIIIFGVVVITISRLSLLNTIDQVLIGAAQEIVSTIDVLPVAEFEPLQGTQVLFSSEEMFNAPGVSIQVWRTHEDSGVSITPILVRSSTDIINHTIPLDGNLVANAETIYNSTTFNNAPMRVITHPFFRADDQQVGIIQVATPLRAVVEANNQLLVITLITAVFCISASIIAGRWLSAHLLKPIEDIKEATASIANADDLSTRIEWTAPMDELGELTQVFNHMMERLEKLFNVQQRFIGDVSHELRTPLTSIVGNLELMERYGVDDNSIAAIQREAHRMTRMVNDLLLLTRADFGELQVDFYPLDLDHIALDVYEQALGLARDRDLKIVLECIEPVQLNGNADRLRQLLLNLLNNAIKFTGDNGTVNLAVYPDRQYAIIDVKDTGIGIAENDLQRIFDRFFQADTSRVRHEENDGAGLGLSIARWIVDIHGGTIEVTSKLGEGTHFRIRLPLTGKIVDTHQVKSVTDSGIFRIKTRPQDLGGLQG